MTPELGPEARALLDAARQGLGPDAAAVRRMRAAVDAAVAGGASATVGTASAGGLAAKLGIAGVVVVIAIGAVVYSRRGEPAVSGPTPVVVAASDEPVAAASPPAPAASPPAVSPAPAISPEIEILPDPPVESKPGRRRPARAATAATPATPPAAAPPARGADLAREVALVDRAMAALRRGDPDGALSAVRTHAAETAGRGQLAEDAAAIEIEALCRLRSDAVPGKLAAFDARWPQSAQRSRLTTHCP